AKAAKQESDLKPTENARVRQAAQGAFLHELDMCLRDDGMSEEGRQRVIKFVRAEAAEQSRKQANRCRARPYMRARPAVPPPVQPPSPPPSAPWSRDRAPAPCASPWPPPVPRRARPGQGPGTLQSRMRKLGIRRADA